MNFITKKHISRRTVLRGAGAALALPLLDSMVPAQTHVSKTAASPLSRLACIEMVHGAAGSTDEGVRKHLWSPEKDGPDFEFSYSLKPLAPFGISTTIVNPGFFRTELLTQASAIYAEPSIADYADRHAERVQWYEAMNGQQGGDPARLGQALVTIASQQPPPRRFIAGTDAIAIAEQKVKDLQVQINAYRDLSTSLAHDEVKEASERK